MNVFEKLKRFEEKMIGKYESDEFLFKKVVFSAYFLDIKYNEYYVAFFNYNL